MKSKIALPLLIVAAFCLPATQAQAAEAVPEVTLNIHPSQETKLRDGTVIGYGRIVFQAAHSGYLAWLNAQKSAPTPGRYVLTGKRDSAHQLRVRLAGEDWSGESKDRGGIVSTTSATRASFQIVIDGNQQAAADEYVITANALAIVP